MSQAKLRSYPSEVFYKKMFEISSDWVLFSTLEEKKEYPENSENFKDVKSLYLFKSI